jgi:hypothetical protein
MGGGGGREKRQRWKDGSGQEERSHRKDRQPVSRSPAEEVLEIQCLSEVDECKDGMEDP